MISNIPACSGSGKGGEGREEGGNTAAGKQEGGWAIIFDFQAAVLLRLSQDSHDTHRNIKMTQHKHTEKHWPYT